MKKLTSKCHMQLTVRMKWIKHSLRLKHCISRIHMASFFATIISGTYFDTLPIQIKLVLVNGRRPYALCQLLSSCQPRMHNDIAGSKCPSADRYPGTQTHTIQQRTSCVFTHTHFTINTDRQTVHTIITMNLMINVNHVHTNKQRHI